MCTPHLPQDSISQVSPSPEVLEGNIWATLQHSPEHPPKPSLQLASKTEVTAWMAPVSEDKNWTMVGQNFRDLLKESVFV